MRPFAHLTPNPSPHVPGSCIGHEEISNDLLHGLQNWRRGDAGLPWSTPWTEYSLYFLFAFHSGLYDAFHVSVSDSKQHILQDTAVWDASGYASWDACRDTFLLGRGYLALVQSNIGIAPQQLWNQIAACMGENGSAGSTADASREHDLQQPEQGLSTGSFSADGQAAAEGLHEATEAHTRRMDNVANTAGLKLFTAQRRFVAGRPADGGAAVHPHGPISLAQTWLAEDHNGALLRGDGKPPLLLMKTKTYLRAAARRR